MMDWQDIPGWFQPADAEAYRPLLERCRDEAVVEIGSYAGRSTVFAAGVLRPLGCSLVCVDSWETGGPDGHLFAATPAGVIKGQFEANTAGCLDVLEVIQGESLEVAQRMGRMGRRFGLVFIDGNHAYESVVGDITAWLPLIRPGGIICGHDWPVCECVRQAVRDCLPGAVGGQIWHFEVK